MSVQVSHVRGVLWPHEVPFDAAVILETFDLALRDLGWDQALPGSANRGATPFDYWLQTHHPALMRLGGDSLACALRRAREYYDAQVRALPFRGRN